MHLHQLGVRSKSIFFLWHTIKTTQIAIICERYPKIIMDAAEVIYDLFCHGMIGISTCIFVGKNLSDCPGLLAKTALISATLEIAICSEVSAPMSRPIGPKTLFCCC